MNFSSKKTDKNDTIFLHLKMLLDELNETQFFEKSNSHCISSSELLQKMLLRKGIKSHLVECKTMIHHQKPPHNFYAVGYGYSGYVQNMADTHVILVTETPIPYAIDASIQRFLPVGYKYVLTETTDKNKMKNLFMVNTDEARIVYEIKKGYDIHSLFQDDVFAKITSNQEIKKEISILKKLNYVGISLSIFALLNVVLKALEIW